MISKEEELRKREEELLRKEKELLKREQVLRQKEEEKFWPVGRIPSVASIYAHGYDDASSYASQYCFTEDMEALVHNIVIETKLNELDDYKSIEEEFERRVLSGIYHCFVEDFQQDDPCRSIHFEMRPDFCSLKKLYVVYAISLGYCIASKLCGYREDFSLEPIIEVAAKESGEPELVRERIPEMLVVARKHIEKAYKEDPYKVIDRSALLARKNKKHNDKCLEDCNYHYDEDYYEKKQEQLYNDGYDEDNEFYSDIC